MSKKKSAPKRCRDAETGQFVTEKYADKNPKTTVKETVKPNKKDK